MIYTDEEIRESWRKAADKADHVQVLAELNGTTPEAMSEKLVELGLLAAPVRAKVPFDEDRAVHLHAEGLCDLDIAEMLGVSEQTFAIWRRRQGLPPNRKKSPGSGRQPGSRKKAKPAPEPKAACAQLEQPMTVRELMRTLQVLEAGYPEAVVWVGPRLLQGVAFHAELGRDGKPAHAVVELMDGGNLRAE